MSQAVVTLRTALERFFEGEARAQLTRLRDPDDEAEPETRRDGRWLVSARADEAFEETAERGALRELERARLLSQRDAVRYLVRALPAQARLRAVLRRARLGSDMELALPDSLPRLANADDGARRAGIARELDHALRPLALAHFAAIAQAEEPLCVLPAPPASSDAAPAVVRRSGLVIASAFDIAALAEPPARALPRLAEHDALRGFLQRTEPAAEDAVARAVRGLRAVSPLPWHTLLRALRAPELDSESASKRRWQRVATWLRIVGFERELGAHVRTEPDRAEPSPRTSVLVLSPPRDVRVAQSGVDHGISSDLCAAEGASHALGLALAHPALPVELRWPYVLGTHPAGALGGLALQLWGEREQLHRLQGLSEAAAERVGRLAATHALLRARVACALATLDFTVKTDARSRLEATAEALGSALCCDVPLGLAIFGAERVPARARAVELLCGLSLHLALRERCDEDFWRNPRTTESLRILCSRGQSVTAVEACSELGASIDSAARRAEELVT